MVINIIEKHGDNDYSIATAEVDSSSINQNDGCSVRGTLQEVIDEVFNS